MSCAQSRHTDASVEQTSRFNRGTNAGPREINPGPERLSPGGDHGKPEVNQSPACDEVVLVDHIARKPDATIAFTVTLKDGTQQGAPIGEGGDGIFACPVQYAERHHAARLEAAQTEVGIVSGGQKD